MAWQIYELTNSALSLGLVGLAHFGAQFLFTLSAGHAADRYDRRHVAVLCQTAQFTAAIVLAAANFGGWITPEIIYACVALTGIALMLGIASSLLPDASPALGFASAAASQVTPESSAPSDKAFVMG